MSKPDYQAIDAVVNIWTDEALAARPKWGTDFFSGKMNAEKSMVSSGISLEQMLEQLDAAGIERAFLIAARSGRPGLPGCYHMPYEIVARAVAKYPKRFHGLAGIDPYTGMKGVRELEHAVKNLGFIGAHLYPHWFELAPDHAKNYPFYTKCCELGIPIQMQVGQSMIYAPDFPCRSVGRPISLDGVGIHVGIPWHDEMIAMAWKHANVFIGSDAHRPKYWPESFKRYINTQGQDKVFFGTDFPVLPFARTIQDIDELGFKPEVRRKLLRDNVLKIYGLT